jgi:hypothetical protein
VNQGQKGFLQVLRRMMIWLVAHPKVTALPMVAAFVTALGAAIDELSDAAAQQDGHFRASKGATAESQRLRRELYRDNMRLVARIAKVSIPAVVKVTAALKMPKEDIDVEQLLTSAEALANAAEQNQDALVKQGLAPDAIAQLRSVREQYKAAIDARGHAVAQRTGATERVHAQREHARNLVDALDVLVTRALRDDRATLAEWTQLSRITQKRGGTQVSPEGTAVSPVETPALVRGAEKGTAADVAKPASPASSTETATSKATAEITAPPATLGEQEKVA